MVELGELERHHQDFAARDTKVVVISNDDQEAAQVTKADFPHLIVVADTEQQMAKAMQVLHPGAGPKQDDTNAPTIFIVDGSGTVRWFSRPDSVIARHSPAELLSAIDQLK